MKITADSSVWIDYFRGHITAQTEMLSKHLQQDNGEVILLDLVLMEVLRGFTRNDEYDAAHAVLTQLSFAKAGGREVALLAADIYRQQRRRGITIRSAIDLMVAAWCVHNHCPLLHADRDFNGIDGLQPWPIFSSENPQ